MPNRRPHRSPIPTRAKWDIHKFTSKHAQVQLSSRHQVVRYSKKSKTHCHPNNHAGHPRFVRNTAIANSTQTPPSIKNTITQNAKNTHTNIRLSRFGLEHSNKICRTIDESRRNRQKKTPHANQISDPTTTTPGEPCMPFTPSQGSQSPSKRLERKERKSLWPSKAKKIEKLCFYFYFYIICNAYWNLLKHTISSCFNAYISFK